MDSLSSINKIIVSIILGVFLIPSAFSFGVTTPYFEDNPLKLKPGESADIRLELQNMVGEEDVSLMANLNSGSEIAFITDEDTTYKVPFGTKDTYVNINIKIPEEDQIGTEYKIGVSFNTFGEEGSDIVQLSGAVATNIPVIVSDESTEIPQESPEIVESLSIVPFLIIGLMLAAVILLVIFKNKKKKK